VILNLPSVTITGTTPGTIDWSGPLGTTGADFIRLANWSPNGLLVALAGRTYIIDPWIADVLPAFCTSNLRYEPFAVTPAAALPSGATATLLVTAAAGEQIPGLYPLPLSVANLALDTNAADVLPDALAAVAGAVGLSADSGHQHQSALIFCGAQYSYNIQTAINALPAGGGTVILGPRTYNPAATLVPGQDYVHLIGVGSASIINVAAGVARGVDFASRQRCRIANVTIQQTTATAPFSGFRLGPGAQRNRADNVVVIASGIVAGQSGVTFESDGVGGAFWNVLTDVFVNGFAVGFDFTSQGAQGQNDNQLIGCKAQGTTQAVILGGAAGIAGANMMIGCSFDNYQIGVDVAASGRANVLLACYFEGLAGSTPVRFQAGSRDNDFPGILLSSPLGANTVVDNGTANSWATALVSPATETVVKALRREARRLQIQPMADASEVFQLMDAGGTTLMDVITTAGQQRLDFASNFYLEGFSDAFITRKWLIRSSDGYAQFLAGVGANDVGHSHGHNHAAHDHGSHAHNQRFTTLGVSGPASAGTAHTHGYNDPNSGPDTGVAGIAATPAAATPITDSTGQSVTHTHRG
jgi:hypothetical protein